MTPKDEFGDRLDDPCLDLSGDLRAAAGNTLAMRHIIPKSTATELAWTYYGYADDDPAIARRRLRPGT